MPPLDLRGLLDSPFEALSRANYQPVLVDIPLDRCRGLDLMAFSCSNDSNHPFITTLCDYLSGDARSYSESKLRGYYARFNPRSSAQYMGLVGECDDMFADSPLYALAPWLGVLSKSQRNHIIKFMRSDGKEHGATKFNKNDCIFFGPISRSRGELEFNRLIKLVKPMAEQGYIRNDNRDGDITGSLLIRDQEYSILVGRGQHRICSLAANGNTRAPIRILPDKYNVIDRKESKSWPGVQHGMFSVNQAEELFDRVFEGRQPDAYYNCGLVEADSKVELRSFIFS
ncbi:hypothetical protein [Halomonas sp. IOP_31]|uniref:hypothetical protein n=1 Tax=Halomonas sp. IOP_31 TaxID=2876584 RepID=UPI001E5208D0|nr:hypothetical protein [Halomonas sp. IOP_31]MCD6007021.1 hypothetical protein [Halomonas sp. IOP_31]